MSKFQYAFIVPQRYTLTNNAPIFSSYHLLLAQEFFDIAKITGSCERYITFWVQLKNLGHTIILDNGAYEMGFAMQNTDYIKICESLKPNELILPDVLLDAEESVRRSTQFMDTYQDMLRFFNIKPMAVLQCPTTYVEPDISSIRSQITYYTEKYNIQVFGIPRHFGHNYPWGRMAFATNLNRLLTCRSGWANLKFHFLGTACLPEFHLFNQFEWARGIDSAAPFVYAFHGQLLANHIDETVNKSCRRPKDFFNITKLTHADLLLNNIYYVLNKKMPQLYQQHQTMHMLQEEN